MRQLLLVTLQGLKKKNEINLQEVIQLIRTQAALTRPRRPSLQGWHAHVIPHPKSSPPSSFCCCFFAVSR